jgi:hypothetical protein
MSRWIILVAVVAVVPRAEAGLHLGMKLACKKYGDAWKAGDRNLLQAAVTDDFAAVWRRMPESMFSQLAKPDAAEPVVLSSQKSPKGANVSVQTADGVIVFHLVGSGFQWLVSDLEVANAHGEPVSLKQTLEASLASRDFLLGLNDPNGRSWNGCLSHSMEAAIRSLSLEEWRLVQGQLPKIAEPTPGKKPLVRFFGRHAVLAVTMPTGGSSVQVSLVNEGAWKVDDLELAGTSLRIPSFRKGMPALASVAKLGRFMKDPKSIDPARFVCHPKLREELSHLHSGNGDAGLGGQKMEHLRIAQDAHVYVKYPNRWILVSTQPVDGTVMVSDLQLHEGGSWQKAADLLALKRKVKDFPLAQWLGGVSMNDRK